MKFQFSPYYCCQFSPYKFPNPSQPIHVECEASDAVEVLETNLVTAGGFEDHCKVTLANMAKEGDVLIKTEEGVYMQDDSTNNKIGVNLDTHIKSATEEQLSYIKLSVSPNNINEVSFESRSTGKFLVVEPDGKALWNRGAKGAWEKFAVECHGPDFDKFAFRSAHGKYIRLNTDLKTVDGKCEDPEAENCVYEIRPARLGKIEFLGCYEGDEPRIGAWPNAGKFDFGKQNYTNDMIVDVFTKSFQPAFLQEALKHRTHTAFVGLEFGGEFFYTFDSSRLEIESNNRSKNPSVYKRKLRGCKIDVNVKACEEERQYLGQNVPKCKKDLNIKVPNYSGKIDITGGAYELAVYKISLEPMSSLEAKYKLSGAGLPEVNGVYIWNPEYVVPVKESGGRKGIWPDAFMFKGSGPQCRIGETTERGGWVKEDGTHAMGHAYDGKSRQLGGLGRASWTKWAVFDSEGANYLQLQGYKNSLALPCRRCMWNFVGKAEWAKHIGSNMKPPAPLGQLLVQPASCKHFQGCAEDEDVNANAWCRRTECDVNTDSDVCCRKKCGAGEEPSFEDPLTCKPCQTKCADIVLCLIIDNTPINRQFPNIKQFHTNSYFIMPI